MTQAPRQDRIDLDEDGDVDDVLVYDVATFRLERMDRGHFWMRLYREGVPDIVFRLTSKGMMRCAQEEE